MRDLLLPSKNWLCCFMITNRILHRNISKSMKTGKRESDNTNRKWRNVHYRPKWTSRDLNRSIMMPIPKTSLMSSRSMTKRKIMSWLRIWWMIKTLRIQMKKLNNQSIKMKVRKKYNKARRWIFLRNLLEMSTC